MENAEHNEARKIIEEHLKNLKAFLGLGEKLQDDILTQAFFASDEIVEKFLAKIEEKNKKLEHLASENINLSAFYEANS